MPAAPEIGESDRSVRHAEVVRQAETEAQRRTDRDGRIAGKVAEDLAGESQRAEPGVRKSDGALRTEDLIRGACESAVCDDDLFEETERHQAEPPQHLVSICLLRLIELRHELGRPDDRARDQVREEGDEQRVVQWRLDRLRPPQVYIERVGHRHECVERDADRQHDMPGRRHVFDAERGHQRLPVVQHEITVLEEPDEAEIDRDGNHEPGAAMGFALVTGGVDAARDEPVHDRRGPQQQDEWRIPGRVEDVTRDQQVHLLRRPRERQPVQQQQHGEEHDERERVENHAGAFVFWRFLADGV
ncbi:MAG: hypothetical protein HW392_2000 [Steroidobacteraceae bacterium]|nr:hypothetical protein [Steroidobacteraceae bacterium]